MRIAAMGMILGGMIPGGIAGAGMAQAEEVRQLGAHQHGHSTLDLAIEGERVLMELAAPGMDIVGFEHAATSDQDKAAVERARASLADPLELFVLPAAARCTVESAEIEVAADDEGHGEEEAAGDDQRHTEFHAAYLIGCTNPAALETIRFTFFEAFERAEEIEVNLVTEQGQTTYEVERDAPEIDLGAMM